jgi:hypothetical protein
MKYYLIIEPDEDGNPQQIVDEKEMEEIMVERRNDPIVTWKEYMSSRDPNYWQERSWFVAEVLPVKLKPKTIIETLEIIREE